MPPDPKQSDLIADLERLRDTPSIKVPGTSMLGASQKALLDRAISELRREERLREAIEWVLEDAIYKAPEQGGDPVNQWRWFDRLRIALASPDSSEGS